MSGYSAMVRKRWRIVRAIAQKDIVDAVRNLYILFAMVLPIGLSLVFRVILPGPEELGTLTIAVYDPGGSRLVAKLRELPRVRLKEVTSPEELRGKVEKEKEVVGGLVVPVGFDAAVKAGRRPELTVYVNRRHGGGELVASSFQRLVGEQVWALVNQPLPARILWSDVTAAEGGRLWGEFRLDLYMLILVLVMGLAMTGTFVVPTLLVEEKEKHTLEALLVSPARATDVVAGKALTGLVYSLLIAGVLIALNRGWVGNWPLTALALLLGALLMVAVGLLMGGLFRTTMQVNTWSSIVMLVLLAPSWIALPGRAESLEPYLRLVPTHYMVQVLRLSLAGEATLAQVWGDLTVLAGSVVVAFVAVVWTLWRERE